MQVEEEAHVIEIEQHGGHALAGGADRAMGAASARIEKIKVRLVLKNAKSDADRRKMRMPSEIKRRKRK